MSTLLNFKECRHVKTVLGIHFSKISSDPVGGFPALISLFLFLGLKTVYTICRFFILKKEKKKEVTSGFHFRCST